MIDTSWTKCAWLRERVAPDEQLPNLRDVPVLSLDVETAPLPGYANFKRAALYPRRAEIFAVNVGVPPANPGEAGRSWYVPLRHKGPDSALNVAPEKFFAWLRDVLTARPTRTLVNQNLKFDLKHLASENVHVPRGTELWDTLVASQLVDERELTHSLKPICAKWLGLPAAEEAVKNQYLKDLGQKKDYQDWSVLPVDLLAPYGCGDVERALMLAAYCAPKLREQELEEVFAVERGVTQVLTSGELLGCRVDVERLMLAKRQALIDMLALGRRLEELLGVSIDPNKPTEIADVVANRLGLPILRRTPPTTDHPFGQPRFDDEALLDYISQYPQHAELFWLIRQERRLSHLMSSFIDPYLSWQLDGVIYPNFNQNTARTGRMTADSPNMQQVSDEETWESPTKEKWLAPGARQFFIPRPGEALLFVDYSQIEYRLFAHYANSPRLVQAYRENPNLDMHDWTARVPLGGRLPRKLAKHINFGIIYGMGEMKLTRSMATVGGVLIQEAEAREILSTYHREIPEVRPLQQRVGAALRARGYVKTILGRRRRIALGGSGSRAEQQASGDRGLLPYQALNAICQGSGADLIKDRMVAFYRSGLPEKYNAQLLIPIHDELMIRCPAEAATALARELKPVLETFKDANGQDRIRVPIYVGAKVTTTRWNEAKEIKEVS